MDLTDGDLIHDILEESDEHCKLEKEIIDLINTHLEDHKKINNLPEGIFYPLDRYTLSVLKELEDEINVTGEKNLAYSKAGHLHDLWDKLLTKSIQCLRLFDKREPFSKTPEKTIVAYGMDNLIQYYKSHIEFEGLLYGANNNYRDHIFHVFRTWLIGLHVIIKKKFNVEDIDGSISDNWENFGGLSYCEKISMWTIIAFCHDLGYPLEKSKDILRETQKMMKEIVTDPKITADFSFLSTQILINEYIVKFISTKMKESENKNKKCFLGRVQPKYYLKLTKSLEQFKHGIVSAIVLYNTLLYFLESDFNLNDDYPYAEEDTRQFYIRREILRAIAAHTCPDIYSVKITTFSSLIYICDEMQNWGRKNWHELYSAIESKQSSVKIVSFDKKKVEYNETIQLGVNAKINDVLYDIFNNQYGKFKKKFRDGQHSEKREFDIIDNIKIEQDIHGTEKPQIDISIKILGNNKSDKFEVKRKHCKDEIDINKIKDSIFINEFNEIEVK